MKTLKLFLLSLFIAANCFAGSGEFESSGGGGGGNVIGPVVGTDNAIAKFNADGQHLSNTGVFIDDSNGITGASSLELLGPITWAFGSAVDGTDYSVQRDADATNQLHFNAPTGATFEFSVNDVAEFTLSGTAANLQNNDFQTTGRLAIGDDAVFSNNRYEDFSRTITAFPTGDDYGRFTRITLDPSGPVGTGSESFVAQENFLEIASGNAQDFNLANFSNAEFFFDHSGTGNVGATIALWGGANNWSSGDITFEQVAGYFTAYNNSTGSIPGTIAKAGNFAVAAGTGNFGAGSIARNYAFYAESPYLTGGSIAKNWGLYFEDQEIGTEAWAIQTDGGRVEFGSPSGKDQLFFLTDDDVTQQYTAFPANAFLHVAPVSSTIGGTTITSLTDGDAAAFSVRGIFGTAAPTNTNAAFRFTAAKSNAAGGIQDLGTGDLLFEFVNNSLTSQPAFMCRGSRLCGMSGSFPAARLDISSNGDDSTTQSFQVTSSGTGTARFRIRNDDHVTIGNPATGQNAYFNVNGGNAASGSAESINLNATLAAFNGSDNYTGLEINITNANHTGASNTIYGINIPGITFDADAEATAIILGSGGWNYAMKLPSGVGINFGGIDVTDSGGVLSISTPILVGAGGTSTFNGPISLTTGSGWGQLSAAGSTGGCLMIRDTDNGGWTQCDALDGTLTCSADDGDGECD